MFDSALLVIDEQARPVLIIPQELPEGNTFVNIVEGGIDIGVGNKVYGAVREMHDTSLALLGLQDELGLATFRGETPDEQMPDEIQYVATVTDTRTQ
ncbi:MAG: hypothetical protein KDJ49_08210 [Alphaproteobacteria bacterium]|nr:hypothetical protein [Alphaproteobacteria bacterium]USO08351.1 MAG: hypothetical protein H6866_03835 [Rhodospirillales bacterium]